MTLPKALCLTALLLTAACTQTETPSRADLSPAALGAMLGSFPTPGRTPGKKTVITSHAISENLAAISFCSAGKEGGAGEAMKAFGAELVDKASWGVFDFLLKDFVRDRLGAAVVDEGDAFCGVFVHQPGALSRVADVTGGSVYTSSYRGGKLVGSETDDFFCTKVSTNYLCFEVASPTSGSSAEVDAVAGCFEATHNDQSFSITFGRGEKLPAAFAATLASPETSLSAQGCAERGFALQTAGE